MLSFLQEAVSQPAFSSGLDFIKDALFYDQDFNMREPLVGTDEDWAVVKAYWDRNIKAYRREHRGAVGYQSLYSVQEQFAREQCADIYVWQEPSGNPFRAKSVRGYDVQSTPIRYGKLRGQPSPFLESGFIFEDNLDANIFSGANTDQRSSNQARLNMGVIHLAGAHPSFPGFSEMGGRTDQQYMTTGRYISELYSKDELERHTIQQNERAYFDRGSRSKLIRTAEQRLIDVARSSDVAAIRRDGLWARWRERLRTS